MKSRPRRSRGVTTSLTVPPPARPISGRLDFDALYRATRDDLYAYVATLLRDPGAAEDVTALTFERAMRRQRSFRPGRGSERAWLFGIARNAALATLEPREREVIALKFHGGLSHRELAAVLRVSESNAGTQLHRAMQRLRKACDAPS